MRKIHTRSLRDGDEVILYGAVVRIEGKPQVTEAPGRGRLHYTWPNMPIVAGRLEFAPEATQFTVAGSNTSTFHLSRRGA